TQVLNSTGELDKQRLREIIFTQPEEKKWLETLLHPKIRTEMVKQIEALEADYVILEIPLLIENLPHPLIDRILLIEAPQNTRVARITARDQISSELVEHIMAQQLSDSLKRAHADDILINDGGLADLK